MGEKMTASMRPPLLVVRNGVRPTHETNSSSWQTKKRKEDLAGRPDPEVADVDVAYAAYCKVCCLRAAKHNILRGYNKNYIPGWDEECSCLLRQHQEDIKDSFQDNEKVGVVFLDLTAAYDTMQHRGLHLKLAHAEYCAPAWSRSPHVNNVDTAIISTLLIVTGCLKPIPASYLPVLAGITPASLRRDAASLTLARKAQKYDWHILHKATITSAPPGRLKSRHPYNKAAQEMLQSIPEDLSRDAWLAATWKQTWEMAGPSCIQQYIRDPGGNVKGRLPNPPVDLAEPFTHWAHPQKLASDLGPEMRVWLHGTELAI
ncbi:hypothetical protein AOLI_G00198450 [Acnodon oligacanthus]